MTKFILGMLFGVSIFLASVFIATGQVTTSVTVPCTKDNAYHSPYCNPTTTAMDIFVGDDQQCIVAFSDNGTFKICDVVTGVDNIALSKVTVYQKGGVSYEWYVTEKQRFQASSDTEALSKVLSWRKGIY